MGVYGATFLIVNSIVIIELVLQVGEYEILRQRDQPESGKNFELLNVSKNYGFFNLINHIREDFKHGS